MGCSSAGLTRGRRPRDGGGPGTWQPRTLSQGDLGGRGASVRGMGTPWAKAPSAQDLGIRATGGPVGTGLGDQKVTLIPCELQTQGWGALTLPALERVLPGPGQSKMWGSASSRLVPRHGGHGPLNSVSSSVLISPQTYSPVSSGHAPPQPAFIRPGLRDSGESLVCPLAFSWPGHPSLWARALPCTVTSSVQVFCASADLPACHPAAPAPWYTPSFSLCRSPALPPPRSPLGSVSLALSHPSWHSLPLLGSPQPIPDQPPPLSPAPPVCLCPKRPSHETPASCP